MNPGEKMTDEEFAAAIAETFAGLDEYVESEEDRLMIEKIYGEEV